MHDFLVEIHTEELPPKALYNLASAFLTEITTRLHKLELSFDKGCFYATPRRLAVHIKNLSETQKDLLQERKGPAIASAFTKEGQPTPALSGFARSLGVSIDELIPIDNKWYGYIKKIVGKSVFELLPEVVSQALAVLPIPKRMRWGNNSVLFVRPVHSVLMLYGSQVVDAEILGCKTNRITSGHRFMSCDSIIIDKPADYLSQLEKHYVIADFEKRKKNIHDQVLKSHPQARLDDDLLDEVTSLVEWPVALLGNFDPVFLQVPQEALISSMKDHQRYFPVFDADGKLLPHFVTVSNIASKNPEHVIKGNERVLRARLSDAAFFYETDKQISLCERVERLKNRVFQAKLGTLADKTQRLVQLSIWMAKQLKVDEEIPQRAALLAKTDLTTQLVGEFPELQGIAGRYYARLQGESELVSIALEEQYLPRFSGDKLPQTVGGCILAIADRVDTLVGMVSIGCIPTGDKDPYGLRRAIVGILRIIISNHIDIDINLLLLESLRILNVPAEIADRLINDLLQLVMDRLKPWYQDQQITSDIFEAVAALNITNLGDFHQRILAVTAFKKCNEAESLSSANKRVRNILEKYKGEIGKNVNPALFESEVEKNLFEQLERIQITDDYQQMLSNLAALKASLDNFFEKVMVMTEDIPRRDNRLILLTKLRRVFLHVADIAFLQ